MDIKCGCGGTMKSVVLKNFDFTAMSGISSFLQDAPGFRCSTCGSETLQGDVINFALRELARLLARMPQLFPANAARYLRRYMRLSQQDLADRMGINRVTVAKWEGGTEAISPQHDFMLRTVFTSYAMLEQKPKPAECAELAKAIREVRRDVSVPPPFVIDHFLQRARGSGTRAAR